MAKRVSLTKAERQAGIGAELIVLCQTVTEDGRLSDVELGELRQWLKANRNSDLPAIEFLVQIVERILEDGVVTDSERRELYRAIERVLPADLRVEAVSSRR